MKSIKMLIMCWIFWFFCLVNMSFAYKELLIEKRGGRPIRVIKVVLDGEHLPLRTEEKQLSSSQKTLAEIRQLMVHSSVQMIIPLVRLTEKDWRILFLRECSLETVKIGVDFEEIRVSEWYFPLINREIHFLYREIHEKVISDFEVISTRID